jgi:ribosomal protein S19
LPTAIKNNKPIYTKARACTILPNHVGVEFHVHNGKEYIPVKVSEDMVGYKLGEFAPTRKRFSYRCVESSLRRYGRELTSRATRNR